ncbi:MAG TPA: transglycosylase SLT domain-containing protein [Gemmatimonadales bacterium]|nr:transglycosylase SLT domain-containing protein [Gemmatimonadales bacterium]
MRRHRGMRIMALAVNLLPASLGWGQAVVPAPPPPPPAAVQFAPPPPAEHTAAYRADSLRLAGRPWHAAETLLAAARREPNPNAFLIVEGAKAEVLARRYEHARQLLVGEPWLSDYENGEALAVLGQAEYGVGRFPEAATHFQLARARAQPAYAPLLAVRAGLSFEAAGQADSAATAFAAARAGGKLASIDTWLRVLQARVTRDTAVATQLLSDVPMPAARAVAAARARALLLAGDTTRALDAFATAGKGLDAARLALATGDSTRARTALYGLLAREPLSDEAAAAVSLALGPLAPRTAEEHVALARALNRRTSTRDARIHVERAIHAGDSTSATLLLYGDLLANSGRLRDASRAYAAAARDSAARPTALYRRGRVLVRLGDSSGVPALRGFVDNYPADSAAPAALYIIGDLDEGRDDWPQAGRWYGELIKRYPADPRASLARFRLATHAESVARPDSAAVLYQSEIDAGGPQRTAARFWLGRIAQARGDTAKAKAIWISLAHEDSLGYYGMRARRETGLPPLAFAAAPAAPPPPAAVLAGLARIDTLLLAGLDSEAQAEVRLVLAKPPTDLESLLGWSEGLTQRGYGSAGVRLGWQAALLAPGDVRVLRAIFPWPNRAAVEAEAQEFGVDALLLAALVRQESVFDVEALSPAGARGLAQLLPSTASLMARGLDVTFYPEWITVPDLNLHLGAAHLAELLKRFGRVDAAIAAYNAGPIPVRRWLERDGATAADSDRFIELIPYAETRGYVRSLLRNRELYRALYGP